METYIIESKETITEMFKISTTTKRLWILTTFNDINLLTSTCWSKKYQPLTIDMTEGKHTSRYCLGLNCLFVPNTNLIQ